MVEHCHIGIENGRIVWLSPEAPQQPARRVIQGRGKVAMPGLINTHTHMPMTLLRGYADDYTLQEWLTQHIFPAEDRLARPGASKPACCWGWRKPSALAPPPFPRCISSCPPWPKPAWKRASKPTCATRPPASTRPITIFDKAGETREMREVLERFHGADGRPDPAGCRHSRGIHLL